MTPPYDDDVRDVEPERDTEPPAPDATLEGFPEFVRHVRSKLTEGRDLGLDTLATGGAADDLVHELQEELAALAGVAASLWARLEAVRGNVAQPQKGNW